MLKPALMFQNRAVLQRDKKIAVWGEADPGTEVTVVIQGQSACAPAAENGRWQVQIGPLQTSFQETMTISSGNETVTLFDLMIGDVWFAGGQSNMEFHMRYDADMETEKEICENSAIRFFDYPEVSFVGQINMADYGKNYGFWRNCDAANLERYSAVAYYFAKDVQAKVQIPIGILACNWGGTPAMSWIPESVAAENGDRHRIEEYHRQLDALDPEAYDSRFMNDPSSFHTDLLGDPISDAMFFGCTMEEFIQTICEHMAAAGIEMKMDSIEDYLMPMGPKHEWRPAGVYESMLLPCVPYGIKGFLWYQGCSDSDTPEDANGYGKVFPALIRHWRGLWGEDLPFLFVQLAPFKYWMQSFGTYFPVTRAAQQQTADTVPGTAMAVITDVGMEADVHPKKKQPVGHRLALLAEHYVYGDEDVLCEAPTLTGISVADGKAVLTFDHAGDGLYLAEKAPGGDFVGAGTFGGLEIFQNGEKLDLTDAKAAAEGNTVTVASAAIRADVPTKAAVAETDWYVVNLYNSAGIPARPAHAETV